MWIKQIAINGFGKLKINNLQLNRNLNIIQGPNEAGKTSLACFLLNALAEPGEELGRYEPWDYSEFGGKIVFDSETLEVDFFNRNFAPPYKRKILESIGFLFEDEAFDINDGVDGTVVATLKRKMEETDTGRVLSVTIDRIDRHITEIPGLISGHSETLADIEKEIEQNIEKIAEFNRIYRRKKDLGERITTAENQLSEYRHTYETETENYLADIKQKIVEMENTLGDCRAKYEELKWVETKSKEELAKVIHLDNKIKELKSLSEHTAAVSIDLKEKSAKLKTRLNQTFGVLKIASPDGLEKVYLKIKNIAFLQKMLNQKEKIKEEYTEPTPNNPLWTFYAQNPNILEDVDAADKNTQKIKEKLSKEIEEVQAKLKTINPRHMTAKIFSIIFIVVTLGTLIVNAFLENPDSALYLVAGISFLCAVFSTILWIASGKEKSKTIKMMLDMEEYSAKNAWYNTPEIWQNLNKLGISTATELRKSFIDYVNHASKIKEKSSDLIHIRQIEEELSNTLQEFRIPDEYNTSIDAAIEHIEKTYSDAQELIAGLISLDEQLKNHEMSLTNYDGETKKVQSDLSEILIRLGMNMEEVHNFEDMLALYQDYKLKCAELTGDIGQLKTKLELSYVPEKLNICHRNVKNATQELSDLREDMVAVSAKLGQIRIDPEEIQTLNERRDGILRELETYKAIPKRLSMIKDMAKKQLNSYIGNYGKQFKEEFTKTFNRIANKKIAMAIEDNLTIRLPINGKLTDPEDHLSKSTYDQMLFAYKLSLYKTLAEVDIPLIVDNAFMNYDDDRLKQTMAIIAEEARQRQVIILSSDQRLKQYNGNVIQFDEVLN